MTLKIGTALNSSLAKGPVKPAASAGRSARRQKLAQAVVDELSSWNPREFMGMFKRLHKGALSLIHLNVLIELETNGPMSMGRLAEVLEVSVASATGIVDRMEKRGLAERRHDENDRRVVLVHMTDAGRNVFVSIDERRRHGLARLLESLTMDEMTGLLEGHRALRAAREKHGVKSAAEAATAGAQADGTTR
jgi:DNA-binding MarR family transcriptional regulator